jgi:hypothetical protein
MAGGRPYDLPLGIERSVYRNPASIEAEACRAAGAERPAQDDSAEWRAAHKPVVRFDE